MVRFYQGAGGRVYKRARKLTNAERKRNVMEKIRIHNEIKAMENAEESDEEEGSDDDEEESDD